MIQSRPELMLKVGMVIVFASTVIFSWFAGVFYGSDSSGWQALVRHVVVQFPSVFALSFDLSLAIRLPSGISFPSRIVFAISGFSLLQQLLIKLLSYIKMKDKPRYNSSMCTWLFGVLSSVPEGALLPLQSALRYIARTVPSGANGNTKTQDFKDVTDDMWQEYAENNRGEKTQFDFSYCPSVTSAALEKVASICQDSSRKYDFDVRGTSIDVGDVTKVLAGHGHISLGNFKLDGSLDDAIAKYVTDNMFTSTLDLRGTGPVTAKRFAELVKLGNLEPKGLKVDSIERNAWSAITDVFAKAIDAHELSHAEVSGCTAGGVEAIFDNHRGKLKSVTLDGQTIDLSVESLDYSDNDSITDIHLAVLLAYCPQLQSLNLSGCSKITDAGVTALSQCAQLQSLNLTNCDKITDAGVTALSHFTQLQSLNLSFCSKITDAGVAALSQCTQLQSLNLTYCNEITDAGVTALSRSTQLQSLNLYSCEKITDASVTALSQCTQLQSLNLTYCKITDAGVTALSQCTQLQSLNLSSCSKITDACVTALSQCTQLQSVNLFNCSEITDAGVTALSQCTQLQSLNLYDCKEITDAGVTALSQCTQLQSVNLSGCNKITDAGVAALSQCTQLQSLDLYSCKKITDAGVTALTERGVEVKK
jgi:tRNA U38,U39,U40 pseudouridine synthase TruA